MIRRAPLLAVLALVAACGPGARQRTLSTTLASLDGARAAFLAFDLAYQTRVADAARTPEDAATAQATLAEYRVHQSLIVEGFATAYAALAAAALDTHSGLATAIAVVADLYSQIRALEKVTRGR